MIDITPAFIEEWSKKYDEDPEMGKYEKKLEREIVEAVKQVYITGHSEDKAKENFKESIEEIKALINARKEEESTLGNFVAFLKTPSILEKEIINLMP